MQALPVAEEASKIVVISQSDEKTKDNNVQQQIILYDMSCVWEVDYVQQQLLRDVLQKDGGAKIIMLTSVELLEYEEPCAVLVFSSNVLNYTQVEGIVKRCHPRVILHMSDEWGTKPEFVQLADLAPLVLRQHWFPKVYAPKPNLHQIPLGYMKGFPTIPFREVTQRYYTWSFIGTVNEPRRKMLSVLDQYWPNKTKFFMERGVEVGVMAHVYAQSVFVPNERGANRLDCFRIYEALHAGAIPIVVGSDTELEETFAFEKNASIKNRPAWITAKTWPEAVHKCNVLLLNPEVLCGIQLCNIQWFHLNLDLARKRIQDALFDKTNKSSFSLQ